MSLRKNALPASPPDPSRSSPVGLPADGARNLAVTWRSPTGVLREGGGGSTSSALLPQHAVIRNSLQGGRP